MELTKEEFLKLGEGLSEIERDLLLRSYETIMSNVYEKDKYFWGKYRLISPGKCCFKGVWNWDSAFHALGTSRWDSELAKENILGFLEYQDEAGMLPDLLGESGRIARNSSKPPVFAWATELVYRRTGDKELLTKAYPALAKESSFWENNRTLGGLFHYDAENKDSEKYYMQIGFESGWDNSVRWDGKAIKDLYPIDLNCYMVMAYRSLSFIASEIGKGSEAEKWSQKEKALTERIKNEFWDEEKGIFNDLNCKTGEISNCITPAIFMPLFVGIATKEQAEKAAFIAENRLMGRMPTVSFDHPKYSNMYWRGPTWLNVAFFAAKGLKNYDLPVADVIKKNILDMCYAERDGICENYDSKSGKGLCCNNFSWSSVFLIEFILGFEE
ncbi:MAG: hypothetical protein IKJ91_06700 [Clostridia bacterium]|nr:hypothetical protein [Clostridia bacterium]